MRVDLSHRCLLTRVSSETVRSCISMAVHAESTSIRGAAEAPVFSTTNLSLYVLRPRQIWYIVQDLSVATHLSVDSSRADPSLL